MSRHVVYEGDGSLLAYGFDAPTGGYFWQLTNTENEIVDEGNGLVLSQLMGTLGTTETLSVDDLIREFIVAEKPTPLQINIGKMFGIDVVAMLSDVGLDLMENFNMFLPE
jgi:hypothetical protein